MIVPIKIVTEASDSMQGGAAYPSSAAASINGNCGDASPRLRVIVANVGMPVRGSYVDIEITGNASRIEEITLH